MSELRDFAVAYLRRSDDERSLAELKVEARNAFGTKAEEFLDDAVENAWRWANRRTVAAGQGELFDDFDTALISTGPGTKRRKGAANRLDWRTHKAGLEQNALGAVGTFEKFSSEMERLDPYWDEDETRTADQCLALYMADKAVKA